MSSFSPDAPAPGEPPNAANVSPALRILIVVEPGYDGVFRHVEGLIPYLLKQGQHVSLAYSDRRGSADLLNLVSLVENRGGESLNLRVSNAPEPGDLRALIQLSNFARRIKPDVIHSHSSKAGVLARTLALLGVQAIQIYTPHAYYGLAPRPGLSNFFYDGIERFYGRIGRTICVSEDERDFARETLQVSPDRCLVVPIAVDTAHFIPSSFEQKMELRRELGLPEKSVVLGAMGRLSFQKDPQTLYRAFALAREQGREFHLLHVGQGSELEMLKKLAHDLLLGDRLIWIPSLREPLKFYGAIDGLILTSRYEGCPTVAIEALCCNLPLIVSDGPGTRWLSRYGLSHCWHAPVGSDVGFARAMTEWQTDLAQGRSCNHRALAVEKFNLESRHGDILRIYRTAFSTPARP